jgi:outer membrane protein
MLTHHIPGIWFEPDITTGLLVNNAVYISGTSIGIDIYKGLQNQNTLRRANLSIVAAKYQLLKMQEDVALNVAKLFLTSTFNKENLKVQQIKVVLIKSNYFDLRN